jgi:hypothetical protein
MLLDCAAASMAAQQQRLAGGIVTRAAGRQLRGMREVVAPAAAEQPCMDVSPDSAQLHRQVGAAPACCSAQRRLLGPHKQAVCAAEQHSAACATGATAHPLSCDHWQLTSQHQTCGSADEQQNHCVRSTLHDCLHIHFAQVVGLHEPASCFPPEAVEAVLLWADPWLSAKVFGAGLYALICFRQVAAGEEMEAPIFVPSWLRYTWLHRTHLILLV